MPLRGVKNLHGHIIGGNANLNTEYGVRSSEFFDCEMRILSKTGAEFVTVLANRWRQAGQ